ncbi:MAG: hypothetical protein A3C88_01120 [Candidatus Yanofskybacteria bacterium RIFCSPHIGHO2_02_FULL_50_12]|uniref:Uncharacterized protein n=1 Tax=Candidatus Yanofskybacteria bacterium RIFCSPHIGHO2_02_FULL_50_12 TaxID=1802685 RepID=A0A1F8FWH1_9BACT|nr:MAG: hypothetical protein A3C88_01120 [Candidatus Yanofskybacteria bacterium RIFCSPHIGHO2_02_FULL_50_12]
MFIIVPLTLIIGSLAGIAIIVYRKLPYLKKLTPESHEVGVSMIHDLFPELVDWITRFDLQEYKQQSLRELEKMLRKLRVASLKIDNLADLLIKRIRKVHLSRHLEQVAEKSAELEPVESKVESLANQWKAQEQKLIVDIAQNPKDPHLYEVLGDLYMKINNMADAKEAYEAALGLIPNDEGLARKYSKLLQTPVA